LLTFLFTFLVFWVEYQRYCSDECFGAAAAISAHT